jgi:ADP-heptose:LPS heptosyltransferase
MLEGPRPIGHPWKVPADPAIEQAAALASRLLESLQKTGEAPSDWLDQLCALATADDPAIARAGSLSLFRNIVEPFGDTFEPAMDALYVRFFCGVIDCCRRRPSFHALDAQLRRFGLETNQKLLERAARIRNAQHHTPIPEAASHRVKTVLVPSRVTLGADIAVTSVILNRLKCVFPGARMALLGSAKAGSLFASDAGVSLVETAYPRGGTLRERLDAWLTLCQSVAKLLEGLKPGEYAIVDPDSRLTQLGLLPLEPDDSRYYFFESRSYSAPEAKPLAVLAGRWLTDVFGPPDSAADHSGCRPDYPCVALPAGDMLLGEALQANAGGRLAAVNLGVGGNADKRVEDPFEAEALLALLKAGYTVVLDRGVGDEELERTGRLIGVLQAHGKTVRAVPRDSDAPPPGSGVPPADAYVWEGSLSGFGGLIAAADLYCGYDSAGGHLAAALGVGVIDIFTDATPLRFRERWTPWGRGPVRVITAGRAAPGEALQQFQAALREQGR